MSLVEVMVVVTIVSILASIAYPSYLEQSRKSRRAAAKAMLHQVMQQSERYYTEHNTFTDDMEELGFGTGPYKSENGSHVIALDAGPSGDIATSVSATATPVATDDACNVLTLSSDMSHSASGSDPAICW
jgi:type IV pilus assembly protein PilE